MDLQIARRGAQDRADSPQMMGNEDRIRQSMGRQPDCRVVAFFQKVRHALR